MSESGGSKFEIDQYVDLFACIIAVLLCGFFLDVVPGNHVSDSDDDRALSMISENASNTVTSDTGALVNNFTVSGQDPVSNMSLRTPIIVGDLPSWSRSVSDDILAYLLMVAIPVIICIFPGWMFGDRVMFERRVHQDQESKGDGNGFAVEWWVGEGDGSESWGSIVDE